MGSLGEYTPRAERSRTHSTMSSLFTPSLSAEPALTRRGQAWRDLSARVGLYGSLCLATMSMTFSGCGGGSASGVKAGPISVANSSGVAATGSALSIGSTLKLSMMPSGDTINAGVDWTVTCGGNPVSGSITNGACGTLTPAHTADGATTVFTAPSVVPIGTTVTITAAVTSNPSQTSSVSLTVLSTPIAISFSASAPIPGSMEISTTTGLLASVQNDPINGGIIWTATCGSAACGSFNPLTTSVGSAPVRTTYTAPASIPTGGTVTITATSLTDTTKSVSATVTITEPPPPPPPPPSIAVSVLPANAYVQRTGPGRSTSLTALVSNDASAGGVDWTLSCSTSNCGSISGHTASAVATIFNNTSTVTAGGTITVTAKSTTDPSKSASATVNVVTNAPIVVAMSTTF